MKTRSRIKNQNRPQNKPRRSRVDLVNTLGSQSSARLAQTVAAQFQAWTGESSEVSGFEEIRDQAGLDRASAFLLHRMCVAGARKGLDWGQ